MRGIFVRDKDPKRGKRAQLQALGTMYPCKKTRIDNAPELCGIAINLQDRLSQRKRRCIRKNLTQRHLDKECL